MRCPTRCLQLEFLPLIMFSKAGLFIALGLILSISYNALAVAEAGVSIDFRKERLIRRPGGTFDYDAALEQIAHDVK